MNSFTDNTRTAARPAKFMFGTEFGAPKEIKKPVEWEAEIERLKQEVEAAEQRGFAAGREAGYASAKEDADSIAQARLAGAMEQIAASASSVFTTMDRQREELERTAIDLAITTGKSLARTLIARSPMTEIETLVGNCLAAVRAAPHLVVRTAPDMVEEVEQRLKRLAYERGFQGRVVVIGAPEIHMGDCRIEWADGGMVRDQNEIEAGINAAVRNYLEARSSDSNGEGR